MLSRYICCQALGSRASKPRGARVGLLTMAPTIITPDGTVPPKPASTIRLGRSATATRPFHRKALGAKRAPAMKGMKLPYTDSNVPFQGITTLLPRSQRTARGLCHRSLSK